MKKYILPCTVLLLLNAVFACGSKNIRPDVKPDTSKVNKDTIPVIAEYDIHTLKDSNSITLNKWIEANLPADKQLLKPEPTREFLKIIAYPKQASGNVIAETIRDTTDSNCYLTYVYDADNFLLVFMMDGNAKTILAAEDWTDEVADHFYKIKRFGKNYLTVLGHSSSGTDNTYSFLFNSNLKKIFQVTDNYECWSDEPYSSQQMHTSCILLNDSTLRLDIEFKNSELEKVKKQFKMQMLYKIQQDTVVCINPEQLKTYNKKRKEFNIE